MKSESRSRCNQYVRFVSALALVLLLMVSPMAYGQSTETIHLDFWVYGFGENPAFLEMMERWNQQNPHIQVNAIPQAISGHEERVLLALISGTAPDILMLTSAEIISLADQGYLVPIDSYVEEAGLDLDIFFPSEISTFFWDDQLWALPWPTTGGQESIMFYNRTLFAESGLDPDDPPKTWSDLETMARRINRMEGGKLTRLGINLGSSHTWSRLLHTNNGDYLDPTGREVRFGRPESVQALEWMIDFTNELNQGWPAVREFLAVSGADGTRFRQGLLGALFDNVSKFAQFNEAGIDYGVGLIPYNDRNPLGSQRYVAGRVFGWGHVIPLTTPEEKRKAAFEFIQFLTTSPDGGCEVLKQHARPSSVRECTLDPEYYRINPYWDVVAEAFEKEIRFPMTPVHLDIQAHFVAAYQAVFGAGESPRAAAENAAQIAQAILDDYWAEKDARSRR